MSYRCTNCDGEIVNLGLASMSGPARDLWVHTASGHTKCDPEKGPKSPGAYPAYKNGGFVPSGYATWDQLRGELGFTPEEEILIAKRSQSIVEQVNDSRGANQ